MLPTRIGAIVLGAFGALALLLAAIGLYGVVAYSVSRRTREVGIRMALGAQRGEILRTMAARGGRLAIAGLVIGALLATAAGSLLESMLYGVSAVDAIAFAAAAVVMVGVAALANLIPAAGATRIDPVRACGATPVRLVGRERSWRRVIHDISPAEARHDVPTARLCTRSRSCGGEACDGLLGMNVKRAKPLAVPDHGHSAALLRGRASARTST